MERIDRALVDFLVVSGNYRFKITIDKAVKGAAIHYYSGSDPVWKAASLREIGEACVQAAQQLEKESE